MADTKKAVGDSPAGGKDERMMKKAISLALVAAMAVSLSACGQKESTNSETTSDESTVNSENPGTEKPDDVSDEQSDDTDVIVGGYNRADSPVITDEVKALVDRAFEDMVGAVYEPVAYIGSQVVKGTNHCILCKTAPVVLEPTETYALVYLYEDLDGNVEVSEIIDSGVETNISDLEGGWRKAESPVITEEVQTAFDKATDELVGVSYTPLAVLSSQVVSGTNYCIFCESKAVVSDAEAEYGFFYLYVDLEGNAEMTDYVPFDQANNDQGGEE